VEENLQLGAITRKDNAGIVSDIERMYAHFPVLKQRHTQQAGTLSGGEQQMLAVGRAMISGPKLLMLDEPSMGLAPLVVAQVMEVIQVINARGTAVLLVEQNARAALRIAHRAYVIDSGRVTLSGPAAELAGDSRVVDAYLGA